MNKMQKIQSINDRLQALRKDNSILGELCLKIQDCISDERLLPSELRDETIAHLKNMKEVYDVCVEDYKELTGAEELPAAFEEADLSMKEQYELCCKEEIMKPAIRFKRLKTDNPIEINALKEAQDKVDLIDLNSVTVEECREIYRPYTDFMEALEEKSAIRRIGYVRKLEDAFEHVLIAGAVINQDLYDSDDDGEFEEEDFDEYDPNVDDFLKVPSYVSDEDSDENDDSEIDETISEKYGEEADASLPEKEEIADIKEDAPADSVDNEDGDTFREETTEESSEETTGKSSEGTEPAEGDAVTENYLDVFDRDYIAYYRIASEKEKPLDFEKLSGWAQEGETFGEEGVRNILTDVGFHIAEITEQDRIRGKYECYNVILDRQDSVLTGKESLPLANFKRESCEEGFRVVCLYGIFNGESLSRAFREIGNRHHTLILFQEPITQGVRRSLVRLVRKEGISKEFAMMDKVVYAYLGSNYSADEINKMFLDIVMPGPETE